MGTVRLPRVCTSPTTLMFLSFFGREMSERFGMRRMRVADEVVLHGSATENLCVYLSEEYLDLPLGVEPASSIYVQVQTQLSAMGIQVDSA